MEAKQQQGGTAPVAEDELAELGKQIRKIVDDNRKFLERVMDEDFEPEDDREPEAEDDEPQEEL